jgi:TPR repeat protein
MYQTGVWGKRDYKQAYGWARKAAEQNLPDAEEMVGYFYQNGFGIKRDYAQALAWYRRAAGHGNSKAENQLGFMAEKGWGQPQSFPEAFSWYYKAADHGNSAAMENIGYDFQYGIGVAPNYAQARSWLYKAAALENSDAENQLGWMFQFGQGVRPDEARAYAWYQLSADQGNVNGINNHHALEEDAEDRGGSFPQSARDPLDDAVIQMVQRRAQIRDLRAQITGLETDAVAQDNSADELAHMGDNGKKKDGVIAKAFDAFGTVVGQAPRFDAAKSRAQAALLRQKLAALETQDQASAIALVP